MTATIREATNVSVNTSFGSGLTGSLTSALTILNSTITAPQIAAAIADAQSLFQQTQTTEDSLPASEGSTGRGDSTNLPTRKNGEINTPVGVSTPGRSFKPININAGLGNRTELCIDSGVNLPPELGDQQSCK